MLLTLLCQLRRVQHRLLFASVCRPCTRRELHKRHGRALFGSRRDATDADNVHRGDLANRNIIDLNCAKSADTFCELFENEVKKPVLVNSETSQNEQNATVESRSTCDKYEYTHIAHKISPIKSLLKDVIKREWPELLALPFNKPLIGFYAYCLKSAGLQIEYRVECYVYCATGIIMVD